MVVGSSPTALTKFRWERPRGAPYRTTPAAAGRQHPRLAPCDIRPHRVRFGVAVAKRSRLRVVAPPSPVRSRPVTPKRIPTAAPSPGRYSRRARGRSVKSLAFGHARFDSEPPHHLTNASNVLYPERHENLTLTVTLSRARNITTVSSAPTSPSAPKQHNSSTQQANHLREISLEGRTHMRSMRRTRSSSTTSRSSSSRRGSTTT